MVPPFFQDACDFFAVKYRNISVNQSGVTFIDAYHFDVFIQCMQGNRRNCGIHAGRVTAGGQDTDSSEFCHNSHLVERGKYFPPHYIIINISL